MEKELAQFTIEEGGMTFLVEVAEPESGRVERVAIDTGQMVIQAQQTLDEAMEKIKPVANKVISKLKDGLATPADEVEVKFGLKLSAEAGVVFSAVGGEVTFEVTLKWTQP